MLGKQQVVIAGNQFTAGLCTADNLGDGGMGTLTSNINALAAPGVIYATGTQSKTGLDHPLVATSADFENQSQVNRWLVDTDSGFCWYVDSSNVIHSAGNGGTGTYTAGISDCAPFRYNPDGASALFMTSTNDVDVIRGTLGSITTKVNYWTAVSGLNKPALVTGVPHPVLVYQGFFWIADGKNLHNISPTGTASTNVLTLDINEEITSLGIDPGTGLMLIGFRNITTSSPPSTDVPSDNFIGLFDGYSPYLRRKIVVSGTPWSFTGVGGQVFVGLDNTVGLWNGNGVTFMRRLSANTSIPTKHLTAAINNTYYVADGKKVLAYGDIQNGKKAWYPLYTSANTINAIFRQSRGVLGVNSDSSSVQFISLLDNAYGAGTGSFYTNNISFPRPVFIRGIRVFTTGVTTTTGIGGVGIVDENGTTHTPTVGTFVVPAVSSPKYWFDFTFGSTKVQTLQPFVTLNTQVFGIVRMVVYYDVAE